VQQRRCILLARCPHHEGDLVQVQQAGSAAGWKCGVEVDACAWAGEQPVGRSLGEKLDPGGKPVADATPGRAIVMAATIVAACDLLAFKHGRKSVCQRARWRR
jgi:hypothetical protein